MRIKRAGVYRIRNMISGHFYIGSSVDITGRWNRHTYELRKNEHHNIYLQNAWNKYGKEAFVVEIMETCEPLKEVILTREQYYLDLLNPEYNICTIAGSSLGYKQTDEEKEKHSNAMKGKIKTKEHKSKISASLKGNIPWNKGKSHSQETIKKIKEARARQVIGPMTEEQKKKISDSQKARIASKGYLTYFL